MKYSNIQKNVSGVFFNYILFILFFFFYEIVYAQTPEFIWAKQAGGIEKERTEGISIDSSGNIVVTGWFTGLVKFDDFILNSTNELDILIAKYNKSGKVLWAKQAGGWYYDSGNDVTIDRNGNSIITGYFSHTVEFEIGRASCRERVSIEV